MCCLCMVKYPFMMTTDVHRNIVQSTDRTNDIAIRMTWNIRLRFQHWMLVFSLTVAIVSVFIACVLLSYIEKRNNHTKKANSSRHEQDVGYKHAAIATENRLCTDIARDILENKGGSTVDAAIAVLICYNTVKPISSSLAGGFFMIIYDSSKQKAIGIEARETAPGSATEDMFVADPVTSRQGGLSIGVPGEIKGYEVAHKQYGKLPWKELFKPSIELAKNGFHVGEHLADKLSEIKIKITKDKVLQNCFTNTETGCKFREGELLKLPKLAETMEIIAEEGARAFYEGSLTDDIVAELQEKGSIITREDLKNYRANQVTPLNTTLVDGSTVYTMPTPSSGPVLSFFLNILDGFKENLKQCGGDDENVKGYQRIVEALKFAHAKRTHLGDDKYLDLTEVIKSLSSREYADNIRNKITDNATHDVEYYGPAFHDELKTGTAHVSIVGPDNVAVAATNSLNLWFGSGVMGRRSGLLYNDAMDDFSSPNMTDANFIPSFTANLIRPGKRPLSSRCPTIIVDKNGKVKIVIGAAGGSRIVSATAFVLTRMLWFNETMREALDHPRLHHQLVPPILYYDPSLPEMYIKGLKAKGHTMEPHSPSKSFVNGVFRQGDLLMPHCDRTRPGGSTTGF